MLEQYYFKINGMKCEGCVTNVENAVKDLSSVESVEVDLESAMAVVKSNGDAKEIGSAIDAAGYNAILIPE